MAIVQQFCETIEVSLSTGPDLPPDLPYAHELAWHDGNGHSHVQAALLGPSINLPIRSRKLRLGTWQQVVAINHDNRPRKRSIEVTIIGVV